MVVSSQLRDEVMEIVVNSPPVNALGHAVRAGLAEAIEGALRQPEVSAIVLRCAGRTFFAGADISEFGKPPRGPVLPDLCDLIERSAKPVVAAVHGTALGGGLEVALACHYRIATEGAQLGTPEVKLGLLPGAGGTQRLPRLVGVAAALDMIVLGDPISAERALALGLLDRVSAPENLANDALAFARAVANDRPLPRTGGKGIEPDRPAIERFKAVHDRKLAHQDAPQACIEAIAAATTLPIAEGLEVERRLFGKLVGGDQSKALRHYFFAERKAVKIEGLDPDIKPGLVASVGVIGAGTMGTGIAMAFVSAGLAVTILDTSQEALDRGVAQMRSMWEAGVAKGRITPEDLARYSALLTPALNYQALRDCDLIIEAVFELMEVKREVLGRVDDVAKPDAIIATNTSYLDVDAIALAAGRPEQVIGLHFFSPAHVMKLLEIVRGARTAPNVLASAMALAKRIGKIPVVSGNCHGFIGNRMLARRREQAFDLLMEGATVQQIDEALVAFGMPMGPFQMSDLAGVDIGWHRDPSRVETVRDALCAAGRFGQKSGKGYYDYDENRKAAPSRDAQAIIEAFAARAGHRPRSIAPDEIRERCLFAMINEGANILAEGIAQRSSDIDVVWVNGYGWPKQTGGPMFWAEQVGLRRIVERLASYHIAVAPLLAEKAREGQGFESASHIF